MMAEVALSSQVNKSEHPALAHSESWEGDGCPKSFGPSRPRLPRGGKLSHFGEAIENAFTSPG